MRIHIYFHPQGKVWAINQAADSVVFGGEARGLQERSISKKSLWDICTEKTRDGYEKFGEFDIFDIAAGAFCDAVWVVREMYHHDIQPVLDYMPEIVFRPVFEALAHGMEHTSINERAASLALCWLNDHATPAALIVPMVPVRLVGGRGCYFN